MTDSFPLDVQYGHFGEPSYDHESKLWHFSRRAVPEPKLRFLGQVKQVIAGSLSRKAESAVPSIGHHFRLSETAVRDVELSSILKTVDKSLIDSRSESSHSWGDVHVTVNAESHTRLKKVGKVPILVTIAGHCGELLRLTVLSARELGRPRLKERTISQSTADRGESCFWDGSGGPILQLCPSTKPDGGLGDFVLVRYGDRISILKILFFSKPTASQPNLSTTFLLPASRISVQQLLQLEQNDIISSSILDAAFNPWNNYQFACINSEGSWLVWQLHLSLRERDMWTAEVLSSSTFQAKEEALNRSHPDQVPWAKLLWIENLRTLVTAQRKIFRAINLLHDEQPLHLEKLVLEQPDDQMLDIRRSFQHTGILIVLTTLKVVVVKIEYLTSHSGGTGSKLKASRVLSWVHDRNPLDLSLSLEIAQYEADECCAMSILMVYSRYNALISVYTAQFDVSTGLWMSFVDPYSILIPPENHDGERKDINSPRASLMLGFRLSPLFIAQPTKGAEFDHEQISSDDLVQRYTDLGVHLFQIRVLYPDFSVSEGLLFSAMSNRIEDVEEPQIAKASNLPEAQLRVVQTPFVVDDYLSQLRVNSLGPVEDDYGPNAVQSLHDPRTLDFRWLVERLNAVEIHSNRVPYAGSATKDVRSTLGTLEAGVTNTLTTLSESLALDIRAKDLRSVCLDMNDAIQPYLTEGSPSDLGMKEPTDSTVTVRNAALPGFPQNAILSPDEAHYLYTQLCDSIASDPQGPLERRRAFEELAKVIAFDINLASYSFGHSARVATNVEADSQTSNIVDLPTDEDGAGHSLMSFTSVSEQPLLPPKMKQMLDRWAKGTAPDKTNWTMATQQILSLDADSQSEAPGSSKKKKAKRDRRLEAAARQAFANQETDLDDLGIGASQPLPLRQPRGHFLGSSSQISGTQDSDAPMILSQPERGLHGQRLLEKQKKKRKRREGF